MLATTAVVLAGLGLPAQADTSPVDPTDPRTPVTVAADGLPTVQIDGVVWSQVVVGNTVYVAGKFTTARPAGSAAGVNTVPRSNVLAYDIRTGELLPWAPVLDGQALSIARSPDGSRIYVTGDFNRVDGAYHVRIAAFDTATGAVVAGFRPTLASRGLAVTATNTTVYVGGNFTSAASVTGGTLVPRSYLAAFSAATGALTPFVADADAPVTALAATVDGSKVVVGGRFTTLGGADAYGLGWVDPTSGAPTVFPANQQIRNAGTASAILSLYADASGIYGSGYHFGGGGNLEGPFRADATTGELIWVADCHGDTYSVYPLGDAIYTASHQHYCGNMGGFPQTEPWTLHFATAFSKAATGVNTPDIYGYADHPGEPAPSLLTWYPQLYSGTYTGQGQAGWSVAGNDDYVVYGGEFPGVNGQPQQGLVRFARTALAPNKQGPRVSGAAFNPRLNSFTSGTVRVSFTANWDRDNETLTYRLYRQSQTVPAIYTTTVTARDWELPTLGFTDTGLTPGSSQRYRLTATDPYGNVAQSEWVTVTVAASGALSTYGQTVLDDNPSSYWRLGEVAGTTSSYDWSGLSDLSVGTGVGRSVSGAVIDDANTASSFDGTGNGLAATQTAVPGPQLFTVESWFRTTTTSGGKIIGFGNAKTGESSNYDRHVYMEPSGQVTFGVYPGTSRTVTSAASFNDGQWHHVVASLGTDGMRLYVDGKRVGQRSDTISAQSYNGYWRVGGDSPWSGAAYFAGDIDEVAVYPTVLSWQQVLDHYTASGRTSPVPPVPADAYGAAVRAATPDLYWRFGESSGTTAQDTGVNDLDGTYVTGVTLGTPGAISGTSSTAVTFDGTSGLVSSQSAFVNPTTYSEELWFSTTTTNGGKLIGFGGSATGLSGSYDRHVYMESSGQLTFGVWTGFTNTITSPVAYNDGAWHHMVATQSAAGMRLYVDGVLVGTNGQIQAQDYTGYWRVGSDTTWGPQPYFAGSIDEVAVYSDALSAQTVADHYALGTAGTLPNQAPLAVFGATTSGLGVSVDGTGSSDTDGTVTSWAWDFGDGATGTGSTASHAYATAGTRTITLTVTDDLGATASVQHDVTVTAPANQLPTAAFTASASGLGASFDGSGSTDPDGVLAGYAWDFGDGTTGTGATTSHTYATAGTWQVTLTVTDAAGATASVVHPVQVTAPNAPPTASFTSTTTGSSVVVDGTG
ncbi:MAG: PKD domain-containing protein, partial [Cellulomonadaceae bacterium]|nr:PKD domain-containing protein [Cellulomonadaceae bacterium]